MQKYTLAGYNIIVMFRNLVDNIVSKISNLNPITHFIRYALDKTLNQFLKKELKYEDFKNGPLNLRKIEINTEKINREHLVSSPYIMDYGIIDHLHISLPPLSELSTQSIEIAISGVHITLKPNKQFAANLKDKMMEIKEMQSFRGEQERQLEEEVNETGGPIDFFKQLLKKIIMNIKVNVSNIIIKLYMNTPSRNKQSPQFYLMLRVPMIYLDKKEDTELRKNQTEQIKFNILLPQISLHLLREDQKYPDYANYPCRPDDFPCKYPTVNHPSTILLIGSPLLPENLISRLAEWKTDGTLKNMSYSQMGFKIKTDYQKKTKEIGFNLEIENFEMMVTPIQVKVISRFVAQIVEFKKILENVLEEIKYEPSESIRLTMKKSQEGQFTRNSNDVFSSIVMSYHNLNPKQAEHKKSDKEGEDIFKTIINSDEAFRKSAQTFNMQCTKTMSEMKEAVTRESVEFQAINFKKSIKFRIQLQSLNVYLLKFQNLYDHLRRWRNESESKQQLINNNIPCDYFMFSINAVDINIAVNQKQTEITVKNIKFYNIKLHNNTADSLAQNSSESFYDIQNSVDFNNASNPTHGLTNQIREFKIGKNSHYCVEQILSIAQCESLPKMVQKNVKKYSLIPQMPYSSSFELYKPAITIVLKPKQKDSHFSLEVITLSTNLQIVQDLVNITYPVLPSRHLADIINFKRTELDSKNTGTAKGTDAQNKSIFESHYHNVIDDLEMTKQEKIKTKNHLILQIKQVKIGYRKNEACGVLDREKFSQVVDSQRRQHELFDKTCFCGVNEAGLYLQIQNLKMIKEPFYMGLSSKMIEIGIMDIKDSEIVNLSSIISLKEIKSDCNIRVTLQKNQYCQTLKAFLPELRAKFSEQDIINLASLALGSAQKFYSLICYREFLEKQMSKIEQRTSEPVKKGKKSQNPVEKQFKVYADRIMIELNYCAIALQQLCLIFSPSSEETIVCKLNKIVTGLQRQSIIRNKLCQFKNNLMMTKIYPHEADQKNFNGSSDKFIYDQDIFFELYDRDNPKIPLNTEDRKHLFDKLQKAAFSFEFKFIKRQTHRNDKPQLHLEHENKKNKIGLGQIGGNPATMSEKFRFKKFNTAIEEEGEQKIISVSINRQAKIYTCNLLEVVDKVPKIQQFMATLKQKIEEVEMELKANGKYYNERKQSVEIQSQTLEINVSCPNSIMIDIRPDFISKQNQRILSCTRSVILLNFAQKLNVLVMKDKNQVYFAGAFNINYLFLSQDDRELQLNPLLLPSEKSLYDIGFKNMLAIKQLGFKLTIAPHHKDIEVKVSSILGECSLQTLCLLHLHFQHFINHHIKKEMGTSISEIHEGNDYTELKAEDFPFDQDELDDVWLVDKDRQMCEDEFQVEQLTGKLEQYRDKLVKREQEEANLRGKQLQFVPLNNPELSISNLQISKICLRVHSGNDFNFIKFANFNRSHIEKRTRDKQAPACKYYNLRCTNLQIQADMSSYPRVYVQIDKRDPQSKQKKQYNISTLARVNRLEVFTAKQTNFGHGNLNELEQLVSQEVFTILANENEICVLAQKNAQRSLVKSYSLKLKLGINPDILETIDAYKKHQQEVKDSGWRKIYSPVPVSSTHKPALSPHFLLMIPESALKLTFQYFITIVDEQQLSLAELLINHDGEEIDGIVQGKMRSWVEGVVKVNIGGVISGAVVNLLGRSVRQLVELLVGLVARVFGLFLGTS